MPTPLILLLLGGCELPWISASEHEDRKADLDQDGFPGSADCDDLDPAIHPDAEEICEDGADQDCDGGPGPCVIGTVRADGADRLVLASGGFGTAIAWGDLVGDGGYELAIGASVGETTAGTLLIATSEDVEADQVEPIASMAGGTGDCIGRAVSFVPSGGALLAVGSPCAGAGRGTVELLRWDGDGLAAIPQDTAAFDVTTGIGRRVLGMPDATGDGQADVAVTTDDRVAIVSGTTWTVPTSRVVTSVTEASGTFGDALAAGDVDGDGLADLAIGAPGTATGAVFVVTGLDDPKPRTVNALQDAIVGDSGSGFGWAVGLCDLDGDTSLDLVASAPAAGDDHGAVLVFYGPDLDARSYESADLVIASDLPAAFFGYALDCGGDVDGDGVVDLIVGAPAYESQGTAFLFSVAGAIGEWGVDAATARVSGEAAADFAGAAVAIVPDLDGDAFDEIAVGIPGMRGQGAVALMFGTGL